MLPRYFAGRSQVIPLATAPSSTVPHTPMWGRAPGSSWHIRAPWMLIACGIFCLQEAFTAALMLSPPAGGVFCPVQSRSCDRAHRGVHGRTDTAHTSTRPGFTEPALLISCSGEEGRQSHGKMTKSSARGGGPGEAVLQTGLLGGATRRRLSHYCGDPCLWEQHPGVGRCRL